MPPKPKNKSDKDDDQRYDDDDNTGGKGSGNNGPDDDDDNTTRRRTRTRRQSRQDDNNQPDDDDDDDDDDDTGSSGASPLNVEIGKLRSEVSKWKKFARKHEQTAKENYDRLQELENQDKSDVERLTSKVSKAEQERDEAALKVARAEIALEYGLTIAEAKRLQGTTREELEEDAEEFIQLLKSRGKRKKSKDSGRKKTSNRRDDDDDDEDDDDDIDEVDDDDDDDEDEDDEPRVKRQRNRRKSTRDSRNRSASRARPKERLRPGASSNNDGGDTRSAKEIADAVRKNHRGF